jgi:hypothetical protein
MHISPVSSASTHAAAASQSRISPAQVSAAALKRASSDGDGKTGAAALNDGDAAAQSAARQVRSSRTVDVKA